jgi:NAD(P)-dependent dehydrogenase (short-subunit alcohol dehydrogenase family)
MKLLHQVAVITGASQGIGRDIALAMAREGASCVLAARHAGRLRETEDMIVGDGGAAFGVAVDVSCESGVRDLFAAAAERFAPVSVLVNNAGIAGPVAAIAQTDLSDWSETLAINLTGPWLTCRAAAATMAGNGGGRIINIGSISGKRPLAQRSPYCASKMGLLGLTRALALELGPSNINVNCISPGPVHTARLELIAEKAGMAFDELLQGLQQGAPLRRIAEGSDIAAMCVFLASEGARNITGQDFTVDGGVYMG